MNRQHIMVKALVDTGNRLYEPFTGKPVCIVEYESLKHCLTGRDGHYYVRPIPYHSIGKEHGILWGVTADKLIFQNQRRKIKRHGCIIGIYPGKISSMGEYNAIMHPDILKSNVCGRSRI